MDPIWNDYDKLFVKLLSYLMEVFGSIKTSNFHFCGPLANAHPTYFGLSWILFCSMSFTPSYLVLGMATLQIHTYWNLEHSLRYE